MESSSLNKLFKSDLQYLYSMEKQLAKLLPRVIRMSVFPELKKILEDNLDLRNEHIRRLESIFDDIGMKPRGKKSIGVQGLIDEAHEILDKHVKLDPEALDLSLVASLQRILNYQISAYLTMETYAKLLEFQYAAELLSLSRKEQSTVEKRLARIIPKRINPFANAPL